LKEYTLIVKVYGLERLDQTMGQTVVDSALADLAPRVFDLASGVLSLAEVSGATESPRRGYWGTRFSLGDDTLLREQSHERIASMNAAASEIANEAALEIFGPGTASLAGLTAVCVEQERLHGLEDEIRSAANKTLDADSGAALQGIIHGNLVRTFLQPIVTLPDGLLVGFEALSRGPAGSAFERADQLFGAAARSGLTRALEMACATQAIQYLEYLPQPLWLSINASSATVAGLYEMARASHVDCWRLIVELTEHLPLGRIEELRAVLDGLRSLGARIALDDSGCGYADLEAAASVEADIVKLCMTVIRRLEEHEEVRTALAEAVTDARSHGSLILAEGVETLNQARILTGIGIDLAQGWLYGKPFPASELESWLRAGALEGSGPLRVA
jgi:EAL domain-containing protein (putative c-di-GMP-specific phosphodiesterase class I)